MEQARATSYPERVVEEPMPFAHAALRSITLLGAFLTAASAGCIFVDPLDCGAYAYGYRGSCYCDDGFDGDPYQGCSPIMTWRVTDACDDQADIAWKLFSTDRDWTWPSGDAVYLTTGFDWDSLEAIVCERGEVICFGGLSDSGLEYGVGIEGTASCDNCCFECDAYELDYGLLTCQ